MRSSSRCVRAPSYTPALQKFVVPDAALIEVATDPELVIPAPQAGDE